jgi:hypothetical protein
MFIETGEEMEKMLVLMILFLMMSLYAVMGIILMIQHKYFRNYFNKGLSASTSLTKRV